jgi:hypothetical protein
MLPRLVEYQLSQPVKIDEALPLMWLEAGHTR